MSIESLRIQGFRSLRDVTWKPGRLNVLIGPNGSGKSNLIEGLEVLKLVPDGTLRNWILSRGGAKALGWDNQASNMRWEICTQTDLHYILDLRIFPEGYQVEYELLGQAGDVRLNRLPDTLEVQEEEVDEVKYFSEKRYSNQESVLGVLSLYQEPAYELTTYLEKWAIYPGFRADRDSDARKAAVARLEKGLAPDGHNLIPVLHTLYTGNRTFKQDVDMAMQAAFGEDYEELVFPPAADQRVQLRIRWRSLRTEQSAANLSDGTLRFLMLLAILANPEPAPLIAIDEPETGLHPRMFPIIAEFAAEAAEKTQVIFTTHSPQFLDAFTEEPPTTTVAQMVDGETRLSVLDGEELGRWLKEYSLGSLFRSGELEGMA